MSLPRIFEPHEQNRMAERFRALHVPGSPILLGNAWDAATAQALAAHPASRGVATTSFAVAAAQGVTDPELSAQGTLDSLRLVMAGVMTAAAAAAVATPKEEEEGTAPKTNPKPNPKPVTLDLQDGYDDVAAIVAEAVRMGAVGANIEDAFTGTGRLRDVDEAAARIALAVGAAEAEGVPAFVVNARTDALVQGHDVGEAIRRGRRYLEAGAACVYIWGGPKRGMTREEVKMAVDGLDGRVNVKMNLGPGWLGLQELTDMGVCRISTGSGLHLRMMDAYKEGLDIVLRGN